MLLLLLVLVMVVLLVLVLMLLVPMLLLTCARSCPRTRRSYTMSMLKPKPSFHDNDEGLLSSVGDIGSPDWKRQQVCQIALFSSPLRRALLTSLFSSRGCGPRPPATTAASGCARSTCWQPASW